MAEEEDMAASPTEMPATFEEEEEVEECQQTSTRKKKATNMSLEEMVDMVNILQRKDYDCHKQVYRNKNMRKDAILEKVIRVLRKHHGVERTKDQVRKRWSDLKSREAHQLRKINKIILKSK